MDFRCSDSKCPALGVFYWNDDYFKPNKFTNHFAYEDHSYIINQLIKEKYINNKINEKDFINDNNSKNIRKYFKILFSEDINLMPLQAKDKFHGKFPNNDISTKEIDHCIRSQYRIIKKLHSEKITNTESLFKFLHKEGTNILRVL